MKKLDILKGVASLIVSCGVGTIVANLIKTTTPSNTKTITKFCIAAGSLVLTGIASAYAAAYTEKQIDAAVTWVAQTAEEIRYRNIL